MLRWFAAALTCGLLVGPLSSPSPAAEGRADVRSKLTVYHWWTTPSEAAAIKALADLFEKKYPSVDVSTPVSPREDQQMFHVVAGLVRLHQTPDSFQIGTGYAAQPFVDAGMVNPVDDVWKTEELEKVIPPVLAEANRFADHYYTVPIGVSRLNVVWCNKALLDKHKIDRSTLTTWEGFFKAADTLRAAGVKTPIQLGETWTASHLFEAIMAGEGIATYEDFINGRIRAANDPRLTSALGVLEKYLRYVNEDHAGLGWETAVRRVIKGESAFVTMGDWANGAFKLEGMVYGKDYEAIAVPGTKNLYGFSLDAFPRANALRDDANSVRWLRLAASREGQDAFDPPKGSISPRSDADVTRYDAYQRAAIAELKTASMYPTVGLGAPAAFGSELTRAVAGFLKDRDTEKTAKSLTEGTGKLAGQFKRVWSLK